MKKGLAYTILSVITILSLACSAYLYIEYKDNHATIYNLRKQSDLMIKQIEARNSVIDKALGTNLVDPLSISSNYKELREKYVGNKKQGFVVFPTEAQEKEVIVSLYAPDGHYFGEISYAAYNAIRHDELQAYNSLNDMEMQILHSYMNYITLNPGMSLVNHNIQ